VAGDYSVDLIPSPSAAALRPWWTPALRIIAHLIIPEPRSSIRSKTRHLAMVNVPLRHDTNTMEQNTADMLPGRIAEV